MSKTKNSGRGELLHREERYLRLRGAYYEVLGQNPAFDMEMGQLAKSWMQARDKEGVLLEIKQFCKKWHLPQRFGARDVLGGLYRRAVLSLPWERIAELEGQENSAAWDPDVQSVRTTVTGWAKWLAVSLPNLPGGRPSKKPVI